MYPRVLQQVQQGNIKHLCILSESRSQNNVYIWMNERKTNFTIFLIDMHLRQLPIQPWTFYFHALLVSRQYTSTDSIRLQMSTDSTRLRMSTDSTRLQMSTDSTTLQMSTDSTRLQMSTDSTRLQMSY